MKTTKSGKLLTVLYMVLLLGSALALPLGAEFVFLKTGEIIEGKIVSDSAKAVMLQTNEKKPLTVQRDDIMRILYTKLKMGKVFIQKRDGEGVVAFIVDEDQESYTFRKELYQPEEFTLNRGDVLFMAEKNPSGLKVYGEIGTDSVSLVWLAPYDVVKKYNIYIKENKADSYKIIDTAGGKSVKLRNLGSNRTYYLTVTSVDGDGYESSPSNELVIKTKNVPPLSVENIAIVSNSDGSASLTWDAATDPDGTVHKYRVYVETDNETKMQHETSELTYIIKNLDEINKFYVTAVDELSGESSESEGLIIRKKMFISLNPGLILPLGKLKDFAGPAYGASLSLTCIGFFNLPLEAGIETGFYYMTGKDLLESDNQKVSHTYFMPLYFSLGYRLEPFKSFYITPFVNAGAAYMDMKYINRDWSTYETSNESMSDTGIVACAGLTFSYRLSNATYAGIRTYYGYLLGSDSKRFATLDIGFKYRI